MIAFIDLSDYANREIQKVTSHDENAMSEQQKQTRGTITCLASGSSMLYWAPAGPSLTLSPRRKPRRVINVLAASSTDGGGPNSWLDSPGEARRKVRTE